MKKMLNIRREADGWNVRMVRNGEEHSKYFRFSDGGVRASLQRAIKWRDAKFRKLGVRQWRTGPNKSKAINNTSGIAGVSKNKYGRWVATWNEDGKQYFRTFATKREAIQKRKAEVKRLSK